MRQLDVDHRPARVRELELDHRPGGIHVRDVRAQTRPVAWLEREIEPEMYSASVQGRSVLVERGEPSVQHLGRRRDPRPLFLPGELCASLEGFSSRATSYLTIDFMFGAPG